MSKKQVFAIIISLLIGTVACAVILALTVGTSNELFLPVLVSSMILITVVAFFRQGTKKRK